MGRWIPGSSATVAESPFGAAAGPAAALAKAASALASFYGVDEELASKSRAHLRSVDPELPDVVLSMVRERRLFSRTLPLVVEAGVAGTGPDRPVTLRLRRRRLRRESALQPVGGTAPEASKWVDRFAGAGVLEGATTMTGVQDLRLWWDPAGEEWNLLLQTSPQSRAKTHWLNAWWAGYP
jgi:hypothetical protein